MNRNVMEAIRQQSDDLRDELKDLEQWEEEVIRKAEARRARRVPAVSSVPGVEPPIRGTVSSIKQAMAEEAKRQGKQLPPGGDPIQLAKEKGNELFRVGKTREAVDAYTQGIDLDPSGASTHVLYGNRAMCYIKLGEWASAEKDATLCVQMNRGYAKGFFRRAVARKNLCKLKEARTDLESVLALVPNDASALTELEDVTKKLQAERSRAAAPVAKKIIIEEVEDEDEDEDEPAAQKAEEVPSEPAEAQDADDGTRRERIERQLAELETARKASEEAKRAETLKEEQLMASRRRHNPRVEIIEDVDELAEEPVKFATEEEILKPVRHADPAPMQPEEEKEPEGRTRPSPVAKESLAPPRKEAAPAVAFRARPLPAKELLTAPQSFSEFERDFSSIAKSEELRDYYVSLMNPTAFPSLFGSNMSPEVLISLLRSLKSMPDSTAFRFLKGLSKVSRVGEMALFFTSEEGKVIDDLISLVKAGGVPEAELGPILKVFKPL